MPFSDSRDREEDESLQQEDEEEEEELDEEENGEDGESEFFEEGGISGPDSEEIFMDLVERFAPRPVIALHRAVLRGDSSAVAELLNSNAVSVDATLLPVAAFVEVKKCNALDFDSIPEVVAQTEAYPAVEQMTTGEEGPPNELMPTGDPCEPETNLDALFHTPLLRAARFSSVAMVRQLVEAGADKAFVSPCRRTAVLEALENIEVENVADILRLVACDSTIRVPPEIASRSDDDGERLCTWPLLVACTNPDGLLTSDASVVKALLDLGSDIPPELQQPDLQDQLGFCDEVKALLRPSRASTE